MHILYVEDRVEFRQRVIHRHLADVLVTEATTVHAALLFLESSPVPTLDAALLDYELPDGTGQEVLHVLRRLYPTVQVIGVSADRSYNQRLMRAGADAAIEKRFIHRVRELLGLPAHDGGARSEPPNTE